jgi:hypothetical protein
VRVSKTVLRPGRRNGGTTLAFTLTRRAVVRFTIVRVYPSCKRIGSFSVRARRGVNRVRFNGRFRGRPLAAGTYRLLVHSRGQARAAAAVTIVVVRGRTSRAAVRRARSANACSSTETRAIELSISGWTGGRTNEPGAAAGAEEKKRPGALLRIAGAVKGVAKQAPSLARESSSDALMYIFGLLTLAGACLGAFVLVRLAKEQLPRLLR